MAEDAGNDMNETVTRFEERQRAAAEIKENNPFLSRFESMYLATFRRPEDREQEFRSLLAERARLGEEGREFRMAYEAVTQDFNATWTALELQMQQLIRLLNRQREHMNRAFNELTGHAMGLEQIEMPPPARAIGDGNQIVQAQVHVDEPMELVDLEWNDGLHGHSQCRHCNHWYGNSYISSHQELTCRLRPRVPVRRSTRISVRESSQQ